MLIDSAKRMKRLPNYRIFSEYKHAEAEKWTAIWAESSIAMLHNQIARIEDELHDTIVFNKQLAGIVQSLVEIQSSWKQAILTAQEVMTKMANKHCPDDTEIIDGISDIKLPQHLKIVEDDSEQ
jgi:hypothetical protein